MNWRKINHILHRDIGYFCIGLTLIYGISGIAVNHLSHDFNPSYIIEKSEGKVDPISIGEQPDKEYVSRVFSQLNIDEPYKNGAMLSADTIRLFTETKTIDVELNSGRSFIESVKRTPVLFEMNYLHLNKGKGLWTWLADIYGVALLVLACTGLLMIRGRVKLRGTLLTAAGIALPVMYLVFAL